MRYWSAAIAMVAISILMYQFSLIHNQITRDERNFESIVLQDSIDRSTEYAFSKALQYSSLNQDYDELQTMTIDPTNVIRDFELMMCLTYGMALSSENLAVVGDCIDGAILCDADGYYVLGIAEKYKKNLGDIDIKNKQSRVYIKYDAAGASVPITNKGGVEKVGNIAYDLQWSAKLPYSIQLRYGDTVALNITNGDTLISTKGKQNIARQKGVGNTHSDTYWTTINGKPTEYFKTYTTYIYLDHSGFPYYEHLDDGIKVRRINNILASAINNSIREVTGARGNTVNYSVYLPATTTQSGINPIRSNTLLISMSSAYFAGPYAKLTEPVLAGYRAVSKQYIAGYTDKKGVDRYCYTSQLPKDITRKAMFYSEYEAMVAGYAPSFEYLNYPLHRELQGGIN